MPKNLVGIKPITCIMSYRGVEDYELGFYKGKNRDVLIVGAEIPGQWTGRAEEYNNALVTLGTGTVSKERAGEVYKKAIGEINNELSRINEAYVYLGKDGAGSGFEQIKKLMKQNKDFTVILVACDCAAGEKVQFAKKYGLDLIWSECGGRKALRNIVRNLLNS